MSTMVIHKAENELLTVTIDNVPTKYTVGKVHNKKFKTFEVDNTLIIPAFDETKKFYGWAVLDPAPKTIGDIDNLGIDLFESAFAGLAVKIQQKIRARSDGRSMIDKQLAEFTKKFALGELTAEQLKDKVLALQGNTIVQL